MYACPNCAAALRYSIKSQDLFCDHCDAHFNPYDIEKEQDAGFCSYCGSPTILTYRMEHEIAPAS